MLMLSVPNPFCDAFGVPLPTCASFLSRRRFDWPLHGAMRLLRHATSHSCRCVGMAVEAWGERPWSCMLPSPLSLGGETVSGTAGSVGRAARRRGSERRVRRCVPCVARSYACGGALRFAGQGRHECVRIHRTCRAWCSLRRANSEGVLPVRHCQHGEF